MLDKQFLLLKCFVTNINNKENDLIDKNFTF